MLGRWQFHALTALGAIALLLAVGNATLFLFNREAQAAVAQRQQYVQQSIAFEGLYRDIVKALAESGARSNDRAILGMLAAQGLNVTVSGGAPPANAASAVGGPRRP